MAQLVVTFGFSESSVITEGTALSPQEANRLVARAALQGPARGYHKTDLSVGGVTIRLDIDPDTSRVVDPIGAHLQRVTTYTEAILSDPDSPYRRYTSQEALDAYRAVYAQWRAALGCGEVR